MSEEPKPPIPESMAWKIGRKLCPCAGERFGESSVHVKRLRQSMWGALGFHFAVVWGEKSRGWIEAMVEPCPGADEVARTSALEEQLLKIDKGAAGMTIGSYRDSGGIKEKFYDAIHKIKAGKLENVWIIGQAGRGKTHLAVSMLRILVKDKHSVRAIPAGVFLADMAEAFALDGMDVAHYLQNSGKTAILIDDIGGGWNGPIKLHRNQDDALKTLLNSYQGCIIWTSNYNPQTKFSEYPHLVSRMSRGIKVIELTGIDHRITGA